MNEITALIINAEVTDTWISDDQISEAMEKDALFEQDEIDDFRECLSGPPAGTAKEIFVDMMNTWLAEQCWPFRVTDCNTELDDDQLYWKIIDATDL